MKANLKTKENKVLFLKGLMEGTRKLSELENDQDPSKLTNEELRQLINLSRKYGSENLQAIASFTKEPEEQSLIQSIFRAIRERPAGYGDPSHPSYLKMTADEQKG